MERFKFGIEESLKHADIVVIREGERTISELMERLSEDPENLEDIKGISFKKGSEIIITPERPLLTEDELSKVPHPHYSDEARKNIITASIETSRGCPNDCDYCTVTQLNGRKYRMKSTEWVKEELRRTQDMGKFNFFIDDNFAVPSIRGLKRTKGLLEAITDAGLNKKPGFAQVTVELAKKPEVMKLMKCAGIKYLFVGVESINDGTLKELGKPYGAVQNKEAIKTFRDYGFWVHGMMMVGGQGDTKESLNETVSWMKENLHSMQFFAITPISGTRFYDKVDGDGRILTKDWSLYDAHHVLVRPEHMSPYEMQTAIFEGYKDFYSHKNITKRFKGSPNKLLNLGLLFQAPRSINKIINAPQTQSHLEFLKSIS